MRRFNAIASAQSTEMWPKSEKIKIPAPPGGPLRKKNGSYCDGQVWGQANFGCRMRNGTLWQSGGVEREIQIFPLLLL